MSGRDVPAGDVPARDVMVEESGGTDPRVAGAAEERDE